VLGATHQQVIALSDGGWCLAVQRRECCRLPLQVDVRAGALELGPEHARLPVRFQERGQKAAAKGHPVGVPRAALGPRWNWASKWRAERRQQHAQGVWLDHRIFNLRPWKNTIFSEFQQQRFLHWLEHWLLILRP